MRNRRLIVILAVTVGGIAIIAVLCTAFLMDRPTVNPDDAPFTAADTLEIQKTEKNLGVKVSLFSAPKDLMAVDSHPAGLNPAKFEVLKLQIPIPKFPAWYASVDRQTIKTERFGDVGISDGTDRSFLHPNQYQSTLANRRHQYNTHLGHAYYGGDVYIGPIVGGKIAPKLFFRDVGALFGGPFYVCQDRDGLIHLPVYDIILENDNQLKWYWCIGDLESGKWKQVWLIHHDHSLTNMARAKMVADSQGVWGFLQFGSYSDGPQKKHQLQLLYVRWDCEKGFGKKVRIAQANDLYSDIAIDRKDDLICLAISNLEGVFLYFHDRDQGWTGPTLLFGKGWARVQQVHVISLGQRRFQVVIGHKEEFGSVESVVVQAR